MMRFVSFPFLWLPFTAAAISTYTPCELCIDRASPSRLEEIELRFYIGPTINDYVSARVPQALRLFDFIDNTKPTIFFTFGYIGTPDIRSTQAIIKAYLARGEHNIFLWNWEFIANQLPPYSIRSVPGVGYTLAQVLNQYVAHGLNKTGLNIIGHSLGGQICGFAGKNVNFTLPRITALDPAGPGFTLNKVRLGVGDAEFVLVIHANRGVLGIIYQVGDADFYPNNGVSLQPGCLLGIDICSHYRSVYFYAESVLHEKSFIGSSCNSYPSFMSGSCIANSKAVMGYATPTTARGRYYLQTNADPLYGRGESGTIPETSLLSLLETVPT